VSKRRGEATRRVSTAALEATAPAPAVAAVVATAPVGLEVAAARGTPAVERRAPRRRAKAVAAIAAVVALLVAIGVVGGRLRSDAGEVGGVVVGTPRGEVLYATPDPTTSATPRPTPEPTEAPSPQPTVASTAAPTPAATPVWVAAATPPPTTPAPAPIIVARATTPDETVATWYSYVANGDFDAAYSLWSDRMKATYSRRENLDERFGQTAAITFTHLEVVQQGQRTATVQANFVETYESGSTREFIGYWELIAVGGRWLLDAPHY
jgi:hypothetical protein